MGADGRRQRDFDRLGDLAVAADLKETARPAFDHEDASVGQRLAALDLGLGIGDVFPGYGLVGLHFLGAFHVAEEHVAVGQQPGVLRAFGRGGPFHASVGGDDRDLVADVIADEQATTEGLRVEARLRALSAVAQGVTVILHHRGHRSFPAGGGVDADDLAEGHVAEAKIVGDDSVLRMAPAVDGFAVALDVVSDDFVTVQVEVRLDGGELGFKIVVIAANIAQLAAEGRMAEQGAAAVRIERAGELHRDVLGVERFARADFAAGQELARVFAIHHHRTHGVGHRDALDEHVTHAAVDEHAGIDVLHQPAGQVVMGGV